MPVSSIFDQQENYGMCCNLSHKTQKELSCNEIGEETKVKGSFEIIYHIKTLGIKYSR